MSWNRHILAELVIVAMALTMVMCGFAFAIEKSSKDALLEELSIMIDKNPDIIRTFVYSISNEYERVNNLEKAIAVFEEALQILPDNEDFLNRLGDLYNRKGDTAKVIEIYKKMTSLRPDNLWYYQRLSEAYRNLNDKTSASKVWEELLKKSKNGDVFMQAANFYSSEGEMDKAIEAGKKAVELSPDNQGYLQNLESIYIRAERFSDAEAICKKMLAPGSNKEQWVKDWANSELINIYQRQNRLSELEENFKVELTNAPKELSNYKRLAEVYLRGDKRDDAIGVYEKAIAVGVADRDINNRLLDLYEWTGKFDKAETLLAQMISGAPGDNYLYERLANIQGRAGKKDAAKTTWQKFLEKMQNDAGAYSRYGDRLNEWGEIDAAIAAYKKAQEIDNKNMWYTMRIVDMLTAKERFGEAIKELNVIIEKSGDEWLKEDAKRRLSDLETRLKNAQLSGRATEGVGIAPQGQMPEPLVVEIKPGEKEESAKVIQPEKKKKRRWLGR